MNYRPWNYRPNTKMGDSSWPCRGHMAYAHAHAYIYIYIYIYTCMHVRVHVMIMIQSIFSTLIHSFNIENPAEINKHANKILCQNFERLSEPRPISLVNLQTKDGKTFNIHGNQENIIWYNQKKNSIITYPLNHLPLGIGLTTDLTTDCFKDETITLNSGDILMLATDGLTEAYKNGKPENEQFNEKRLIKILEENKNKNPEEIKETIIQEIDQFTENTYLDDLTFIIIKKH